MRDASWTAFAACLSIGLMVIGGWCGAAHAQGPLGEPTGRPGEQPPLQREEPRQPPPPVPILPQLPPAPPREFELLPRPRVFVREIRIVGNTVLPADELTQVAAPYVNREVTSEDLEALRVALTLLYVNKGYINSGAILPDQRVTEGVVTFQIIEGELTDIEVEGNRWFRAGYLKGRFALGAYRPLNVNALQTQLQLMLEDPRIRRLSAELKPGLRPGESALDVRVEERVPYRLWATFNNYQTPGVGAERGLVTLEHENLTGNGDILTLQYGRSEGLDPLLDFRYALPFTSRDTTLILQYRRNTLAVVEPPFDILKIESNSEIYTITLRQPLYHTLNDLFALEVTGERLSLETSILGVPFSLSPGAQHGKSVVAALRFAQEWVHRSEAQVIAARSRFSVGLDVLGATINPNGVASGQFLAWLGQFQWVRRLPILDAQLIFRTDFQISPDSLLVLEQYAVGGRYTVRGYRENTLVRDNAWVASLEARVPLIRNTRWADYVEVAPFYDYGLSWNTNPPTPKPRDISSAGVGLRWGVTIPMAVPLRSQFEVYWGYPFRNIKTPGGNLQDLGIHLQFMVGAF